MSENTSMAIASIWAWLIPHFYIEFTEYRLAILERYDKTRSSHHRHHRRHPQQQQQHEQQKEGSNRTRSSSNEDDDEDEKDEDNDNGEKKNWNETEERRRRRRIKTESTMTGVSDDYNDDDDDDNNNNNNNNDDDANKSDDNDDDDDDNNSVVASKKNRHNNNNMQQSSSSSTTTLLHAAAEATVRGSGTAFFIIVVVYVGSALAISLTTRNLDRKANAIVIGLGRILSAFLFAVFSVQLPIWLGVTYSSNKYTYYKHQIEEYVHTPRELAFVVCWSLLGHFFLVYCLLLLYFCNPRPITIPLSTAVGITFGFAVVWLVWLGQTRYKKRAKLIAVLGSLVIAVASSAAFAAGCWYVKEVWYDGQDVGYKDDYTWFVFFGWLTLCLLANYLYYRLTLRKLAAAAAAAGAAATANGDTDTTTNDATTAANNDDDAKSTWRYHAKVFQPPDNFCGAATELTMATGQAAVSTFKVVLQPNFDAFSVGSASRQNRARANTGGSMDKKAHPVTAVAADRDNNVDMTSPAHSRGGVGGGLQGGRRRAMTAPASVVVQPESAMMGTPMDTPLDALPIGEPLTPCSSSSIKGSPLEAQILVGNRSRCASNVSSLDDVDDDDDNDEDLFGAITPMKEFKRGDSGYYSNPEDGGLQVIADDESQDHLPVEEAKKEPSLWFLIKSNSCCGRRYHYKAPRRKPWERARNLLKWFLWGLTTAFHIYLTVVNIGATVQQNTVRAALPSTFALLYPPGFINGPLCAWNESSPNADIRTFDTLDGVYAANYSVIHCGACGSCSNWNDLELQWTTRTFLAEIAQECTKKSLGRGDAADVQECNVEEIGFTEDCAWCWTEDQLCAAKQCVFIFLQSVVVNQVSNFNVGPDDVTTATCDEALCGPKFVPCSGATRRRMNIVSDIPRPADQQCTVATEDWTTVFNHP